MASAPSMPHSQLSLHQVILRGFWRPTSPLRPSPAGAGRASKGLQVQRLCLQGRRCRCSGCLYQSKDRGFAAHCLLVCRVWVRRGAVRSPEPLRLSLVTPEEEFVGHEINFKFVAPKSIDTLSFSTICRQVATRSISAPWNPTWSASGGLRAVRSMLLPMKSLLKRYASLRS